jgi:hypothetical protein
VSDIPEDGNDGIVLPENTSDWEVENAASATVITADGNGSLFYGIPSFSF